MLNARQDNRLTAAETLLSVLRKDPAPYATDKAMQAVVQRLGEIIADMTPLRQQAQRASAGKVAGRPSDKEAARHYLGQVAGEVAGDVFSYATDQRHATLQAVADYSQADFNNLRGSRLTDAVQALLDATRDPATQKALAADYDLTPARQQELQDALAAYNGLKTTVRETTIDGKVARVSLRTEFAELGTLLQDRLMRQLRKYERKAPDFYARVVAARITIDRPGSLAPSPTPAPKPTA